GAGGVGIDLGAGAVYREWLPDQLLHHERAPRGPLPVDGGHANAGIRPQPTTEFLEGRRLPPEIDLVAQSSAQIAERMRDGQPGSLARIAGDAEEQVDQELRGVQITIDLALESRPYQLDDHPLSTRELRSMHLRDRSDRDGSPVEAAEGEPVGERRAQCAVELRFRHGRLAGVERLETRAHDLGEKVTSCRQHLPQLGDQGTRVLGEADERVTEGLPLQRGWALAEKREGREAGGGQDTVANRAEGQARGDEERIRNTSRGPG